MRIVVLGAGGLGSYLGALQMRAGHEVVLVARGAHGAVVRERGLHVRSFAGDFEVRPDVVASALEVDGADLCVLAVKAYSIPDVAPQVAHLAGVGADVVSVLNGVDASTRLAAEGVPGVRLLDGIAYMTAFRTEPGVVERHAEHQRLVVGSTTGAPADAVERLSIAFGGTGVDVTVAADIREELWRKMAVVCSLSVVCALSRHPMGPLRSHRFGAELQRRAIAEVIEVGRATGVALPPSTEAEIGRILDAFPADFHPSVIHDLKRGKRTEMEELGGTIAALGRAHGVEAPLHEAATLAVQLSEGGG